MCVDRGGAEGERGRERQREREKRDRISSRLYAHHGALTGPDSVTLASIPEPKSRVRHLD